MNKIIEEIEKQATHNKHPHFNVGDSVRVGKIIVEGKKKRTQNFEGTVIRIQNKSSRQSFTVRKIVQGIGVEKTYLLYSPLVESIKVTRKGKVRRAKLFYLRDRVGSKAIRIKARTS